LETKTENKSIKIELIPGAMSKTIKTIIIDEESSAKPVGSELRRLVTERKIYNADKNQNMHRRTNQLAMAKKNFQKTTFRQEDSRFETEIPVKVDMKEIGTTKLLERKQLLHLIRKCKKDNEYKIQ
jgi:hypothetical protein